MVILALLRVMTSKIYISIILLLTLLIGTVSSQTKFTASVNKNTVRQGEQFQVTFKINDSGDNFQPPSLAHFQVLSGPNQSTSMQWVNGNMSNSKSFSYVLAARNVGGHTIGSAKIKVGKKTYETKPIEINVVKGNVQQKQQGNQGQRQNNSAQTDLSQLVFLKCFVNKSKVAVGEQLIATYKLYYNANIGSLNLKELPPFTGFWAETVEIKQQTNREIEVVNGVRYNVAEIHKVILFPQSHGKLEVSPLVLDLVVEIKEPGRSRSVFDQFFGRHRNVSHTTASKPIKIEVSPLPSKGKPANFSGAVGSFNFNAELDRNNIKSNEAINLKVTVKGNGNLNLIDAPKINFPPDFEVYDPKIKNKTSVTASGMSGKKEFEYLIISRHGGDYTIDPISFTYFDPRAKKYVTKTSKQFDIHVERGADEGAAVSNFSGANKKDIKVIGSDIRFINTNTAQLRETGQYFMGSGLFYGIMSVPLVLFGFFMVTRKKLETYNSDTVKVRGRKANKMATKRLSAAEKHLKSGEQQAFYEEVFKALYGYLGDKLNIDVAQLSKDSIQQNLTSKNLPSGVIDELLVILDNCEMARFAPSSAGSEQSIYEQAVAIIGKIEEGIK